MDEMQHDPSKALYEMARDLRDLKEEFVNHNRLMAELIKIVRDLVKATYSAGSV